ncbi:protein of unknown function [Candidatus Methylomirabilis oxygeniifera]|uniref:Uncharacterized protein n=1 Tax=Methylomirabilis oxygeniifera TaxID=671143 RepID=D5MEU2_METO1|nr:protein of unknown function [Candidatus Methylomirabilis oxyfera]
MRFRYPGRPSLVLELTTGRKNFNSKPWRPTGFGGARSWACAIVTHQHERLPVFTETGYKAHYNKLPRGKLRGIVFCSGPSFRA